MLGGPINVNGNFTLQLNSLFDRGSFGLNLKGNLVTNGSFLPSTGLFRLNGTAAQSISGLTPPSFSSLMIDKSSAAGITLSEDVTINDTLTLANGAVSIGATTLTLNGVIVKVNGSLIGGVTSNISIGGTGSATALPAVNVNNLTSYTFKNVTGDHGIEAIFAPDSLVITASAGVGGLISHAGVVKVNYGADTTFTIAPKAAFFVKDVLVDSISVGKVTAYTFSKVTSNHTITASFYPNTAPTAPALMTPVNGDMRSRRW